MGVECVGLLRAVRAEPGWDSFRVAHLGGVCPLCDSREISHLGGLASAVSLTVLSVSSAQQTSDSVQNQLHVQ